MAEIGTPLKVAGALSGVVYVDSYDAPVQQLRAEVARLLGVADSSSVKLIAAGRTLQDDNKPLTAYNINAQSRILVTRGAAAGGAVDAAAERTQKLEKLKAVAERLAGRDRQRQQGWTFEIENQSGGSVAVKPEDQKSLTMGLTLHEAGKASMEKGDYALALEELMVAEEALGLCSPALLEGVDNLGMLLIDIVWCCYKLNDLRRLAVCRDRLERARRALASAHGPSLERCRRLHGAFQPELAVYVRLEVLEGVVAYYSNDVSAAEKHLTAAQTKLQSLSVSDESLALLQGMGFKPRECTRALRFSGGNIDAALQFIEDQRKATEERKARRKRDRDWHDVRKQYGKTATGEFVDGRQIEQLEGMGYARPLAAEALRQANNNGYAALDALADPAKRRALEFAVAMNAAQQGASTSEASPQAAELAASLAAAFGSAQPPAASASAPSTSSAGPATSSHPPSGDAAAAPTAPAEADPHVQQEEEEDSADEETRQLEDELVKTVKGDPMAAYDIDVSEEGEIIGTYLAMLSSRKAATG